MKLIKTFFNRKINDLNFVIFIPWLKKFLFFTPSDIIIEPRFILISK